MLPRGSVSFLGPSFLSPPLLCTSLRFCPSPCLRSLPLPPACSSPSGASTPPHLHLHPLSLTRGQEKRSPGLEGLGWPGGAPTPPHVLSILAPSSGLRPGAAGEAARPPQAARPASAQPLRRRQPEPPPGPSPDRASLTLSGLCDLLRLPATQRCPGLFISRI